MTKQTQIEVSIAETFKLPVPKSLMVKAFDVPTHFTPKKNESYQFVKEILSDVLAWWQVTQILPDGLYLTGPTGSGKSSIICQIASYLNLSVQRLTAHSRMEMPELIGHPIVMDGDLIWQDGPLTAAMRHGHVFLLDELDLLDPGTAAGLNGILEGAPLVLAENGGEVVHPHPDFRFIATGNTNGGGDRLGVHSGTVQQNAAFMDRMWVIEVGYAPAEIEQSILKEVVPNLPAEISTEMVKVANEVRALYMGNGDQSGAIEITMSTRTLIRWATIAWFMQGKSAQGINPVSYALDRALANRGNPQTKSALQEICQRYFGKEAKAA